MISLRREVKPSDLSNGHRIFLLILVSMGSSIIYSPAYLKNVFYDPLMRSLDASNADLGMMLSAYALTATICYLPSGVVADKVRVRTLAWVGFTTTAVLTYVYAMLPSITTLMFVFVGMGITTILIWWGIRFKLVRLISEEESYSRNIGISYGIYGAAGLAIGFLQIAVVKIWVDNIGFGVQFMIGVLATLILILGVLSYFFIPKFEGEIATGESAFNLKSALLALRNPVVWLSAGCMFFVYFYYTGVNYTTPYLSDVMGASLGVVTFVSVLRTYGVTLLSGPVFGFVAKAVGSPSKVIAVGSIVTAGLIMAFTVLPTTSAMAILAAVVVVLLGFLANGVFGIVSSQLTEGKVPLSVFGSATGILSVVGFLPDTFSSTWFGSMIDASGKDAYPQIFMILAGSAAMAGVLALALLVYVKRNAKKLEAEEAAVQAEAIAGE
ncbi:MFS transporter [Arcanobacterium bovis]|uniref:MFS transporter n=1 Tax=Arcanobacterium bovis TaxID=2529275 RepID=A0A4Q9V3N0_9ACTO|nr:MFS transporter [Arcanobacterium bovis]TBW23723.1 MFS transporter [Arcanobacterium bovis]